MRGRATLAAGLAGLAMLAGLAGGAAAHELRPALLDVTDLGGGRYEVIWKPSSADVDAEPVLPAGCTRAPGPAPEPGGVLRFVADCGPAGLAGRRVAVRGLGAAQGDALARFEGPGGPVTAVLRADRPSFLVPAAGVEPPLASRFERARGYLGAGFEHVLRGPDHLLFVLGLLLLVKGRAALVRTVTAFTLAHSVTLALAVTGAARVPSAPVEVLIALSIVLLAAELARPEGAAPTLTRRHPGVLAFAFGLLHGFGFAGGLAALRVPAADVPLALGLWNLGIEAGQLVFVAAALVVLGAVRWARGRPPSARVPAYVMGSLAAFWCIERVAVLLGGGS